jgi:circadian clock protein KaiB
LETYVLRLYVAGLTPRSTSAIANLRAMCDKHLVGRYQLEVFDLYQRPELAQGAQVLAAPTLVKELPLPVKRLIGDLSDEQRLLAGLQIFADAAVEAPAIK